MLNRREFLWAAGGTAALVAAGAHASSLWKKPGVPVLLRRDESWANAVCQLCRSGCGLKVRLANGSPVTVAGNPLHPVNRGGLCARGAASLQLYYDPDRFQGPLRRSPEVLGGWAPATWDDALQHVSQRLQQAAAAGPGRVALVHGGSADIGSQLLARLVRTAGSDWVVSGHLTATDLLREVVRRMHGRDGVPVHDVAQASFLLSLDSGLLDASPNVMALHRGLAEMRAAGARFVHAGPRLGVTGTKADTWLPTRPSTLGVLALGVAHVLLREGFVDLTFLRERVLHFTEAADSSAGGVGCRNWILRNFSPGSVAESTGLAPETLIRTARQFGASRRPLAIGPVGQSSGYSLFDLMAVHALNAMVGSVDVPGGVLLARELPFEALDRPPAGTAAGAGGSPGPMRTVEELAEWVLDGGEPAIDVAFVHDCDPVFTSPEGERIARALRRIPLVVSTSPVPTDTSVECDVVLPDALWMERRADSVTTDLNGFAVVSTSPPAVRALAQGRATADVALALGRLAGSRVAARFPDGTYEQLLARRLDELFAAGAGDAFEDVHGATWTQLLERSGWRIPSSRSTAAFRQRVDAVGGWWDPVYFHGEWRRVFADPGRRMDMQPLLDAAEVGLPRPPEVPEDGQLVMHAYSELTLDTGVSGSLPSLRDLGSPLSEQGWHPVAELNPETARGLGIAHGDRIRVTGARGTVEAIACVLPVVRPEIVAVNVGSGRTQGGRYAVDPSGNPLRLLAAGAGRSEGRSGPGSTQRPAWPPVRVRIEKA